MTRHLLRLVWTRKRSNALVGLEILVSFLVVFALAALAAGSLSEVGRPVGFSADDVLLVEIGAGGDLGDAAEAERRAGAERLLKVLLALDGVESAAAVSIPPYAAGGAEMGQTSNGRRLWWHFTDVTDGFADTMRLSIVRGRWFGPQDEGQIYRPVVVTREFAEHVFRGADPVGRDIPADDDVKDPASARTPDRVVGVLEGYRQGGRFEPVVPFAIYRSRTGPGTFAKSAFVVRTRPGTLRSFEERVARTLSAAAPGWTFTTKSLVEAREASDRRRLTPLLVVGIVAGFLMLMVALGLTGVLWQNVTRRTREIGLRRAVGASGRQVAVQVVMEIWVVTALAVLLGGAIVLQLPAFLPDELLSARTAVAGVLGAALVLFSLTALCALYPGWLASRVHPSEALRYE